MDEAASSQRPAVSRWDELIARAAKPSTMARLRDELPHIERAIASGVPQSAIVDMLNADGLNLSVRGFQAALSRLRKQAGTIAPRKRLAMSAAKPKDQANPPPPSPAITKPTPPVVPGPAASVSQAVAPPVSTEHRRNPHPRGSMEAVVWEMKNPLSYEEIEAGERKFREAKRLAKEAARAAAKAASIASAPAPSPTGSLPREPGAP